MQMNTKETANPKTTIRGEQALWRAVITQALMDASSNSKKSELQYEKSQASCWLDRNSPDFCTVCDYAGFDPIYVRRQTQKALARNCIWRASSAPVTQTTCAA